MFEDGQHAGRESISSSSSSSERALPWGDTARPAAGARAASDALKRVVDVLGSVVLLLLLTPLLILVAVLIRVTTPGPALFRQVRLGRAECSFVMYKFRTMYDGADDKRHREYVASLLSNDAPPVANDGLYKLSDDPRITPIGAFLRRTSLDELPQLFNVLAGSMSLVGPRPALAWEAELYQADDRKRFEVKPGMTGLWQVSGRSKLTMKEALDLDCLYVERRSLRLDLAILGKTVLVVLKRDGTR
jgi:lipopolysaccharide/colanic/teichoic acid biosynthesis glycosyltransferase